MEKRRIEDLQIVKLAAMTLKSAFDGEVYLSEDAILAVKQELYDCGFEPTQSMEQPVSISE